MKLSVKDLALASAVVWGGSILVVGIMNLIWPGYGVAFLGLARSIYPGYAAMSGFVGVLVGTAYGFLDGFIGGAIFAWIYNKLSGSAAGAD